MFLKKKIYKIISIFLLCISLLSTFVYASSIPTWTTETKPLNATTPTSGNVVSSSNSTTSTNASQTNSTTSSNNTVSTNSNSNLNLYCGSCILIEQHSGQVLYEQNMHEKLRPASVTKVMTILLIMEAIDSGRLSYTDKIPCTENAAGMGGSQIWLDVREELTVDEMLKAICVVSANDCTVAMAEYLAGSQEAFVAKMNEKAQELGMQDTTFKNCHGIDEDGHVTSSYDIALMSKELLNKHPSITKYTTIYMDSLRDGKSSLVNTNKLIRNYKGATGLKTGSTATALYSLSASATRDDLSLIAVIMKAPNTKTRFAEAQKLLDYGFANFEYKKLANKGDIIKDVIVDKGIETNVNGILETDSGILIQKGQDKNIEQQLELPTMVSSPVEQGQVLGTVTYHLNGQEIGKVNIIAEKSVSKISTFTMIENIYGKWFSLLRT